jgi:hypothetical protein
MLHTTSTRRVAVRMTTSLLAALIALQALTAAQSKLMQLDNGRRQDVALGELREAQSALEQHRMICPEATAPQASCL